MNTVRILIADDHPVVRRGLRTLLEAQPNWHVAEAANGLEAVQKAKQLKPDIAIVDIRMPELNGLEATEQIRKVAPQTKVLILSMHDTEEMIAQVLRVGARGYVLKSDAERDVVVAVESLLQNIPFFTPTVTETLLEYFAESGNRMRRSTSPVEGLTPREHQVVQLLAEGKSNKEVAAAFSISVRTVESHRARVMRKFNMRSFSDLLRFAIRNGIVKP